MKIHAMQQRFDVVAEHAYVAWSWCGAVRCGKCFGVERTVQLYSGFGGNLFDQPRVVGIFQKHRLEVRVFDLIDQAGGDTGHENAGEIESWWHDAFSILKLQCCSIAKIMPEQELPNDKPCRVRDNVKIRG